MIALALLMSFLATDVIVERIDGASVAGRFLRAQKDQLVLEVNGGEQTLPLASLLSITFVAQEAKTNSCPILIALRGGGAIHVNEMTSDATKIRALLTDGRELEIPLVASAGVSFQAADPNALEPFRRRLALTHKSDLLIAVRQNEEASFEGIIGPLDDERLLFTLDGEEIPVKRPRVRELHFAPSPNLPDTSLLLHDRQGNVWPAKSMTASNDRISLASDHVGALALPLSDVARIDFSTGKVVYLSDLEPDVIEHVPYFNQPWSYRRDVNFIGAPLRLADRTYAKGLALHSKTRLTYELDGEYTRFVATVGIDPAAGVLGQAIARVLVDQQPLWNHDVAANAPPVAIDLRLEKGKRLTIEVDFGPRADLGDHVLFGDAKLVK